MQMCTHCKDCIPWGLGSRGFSISMRGVYTVTPCFKGRKLGNMAQDSTDSYGFSDCHAFVGGSLIFRIFGACERP